jgi:YidC/Oxa1 family membrane protein insertase
MDKKTMLAIALSALVLIVFQLFFAPKKVQVADNGTAKEVTAQPEASDNTNVVHQPVADSAPINAVPQTVPVGRLIDASTADLEITFNELTGNILKAEIQQYNEKPIHIGFGNGTQDYMSTNTGTTAAFTGTTVKKGDTTSLVFTSTQSDLVIRKKYEITEGSYLINASVEIINNGDRTVQLPLTVQIGPGLGEGIESDRYIFQGPIMFDGKKIKKEKADKVKKTEVLTSPVWLGYTSKYFLFATTGMDFTEGKIMKSGESSVIRGNADTVVNPDSKVVQEFKIYIGPKKYTLLKETGYKLTKSIDYGFFSFLAIPMLNLMNYFYKYIGNYGVAIILLTLVVKLVTFPLTQKSMVSMKRMQKLQPKMTELREKYAKDKEKMNQAVMELYKKEKVNPFGGCLPIVIQIPVFFALYRTLLLSIELKGSPFLGYITDLSLKDPYYVTPILMGVTMFLQQRLTPQTGDPMQQKLFMFMPLIFTFLFMNFPAGLVIYWLTNNILSIAQQYIINKKTA